MKKVNVSIAFLVMNLYLCLAGDERLLADVIVHIKDECTVKFVPEKNKKHKENIARLIHRQRVESHLTNQKQKTRLGLRGGPDITGIILPTDLHRFSIAYNYQDMQRLKKALAIAPHLINKTNFYGDLPIHIAVICCSLCSVKMLIQKGTRVNERNNFGLGTLDIASDLSRTLQDKITQKIRQGIVPTNQELSQKETLLKIIDLLKSRGAQTYISGSRGTGAMYVYVIRSMLNKKSVDTHVDSQGNTLLHAAIMNKRIKEARFLLDHGASVNTQNKLGYSPYDFAYAWYLDQSDKGELIKLVEQYRDDSSMQEDTNEEYLYEVALYMLNIIAHAKSGEYASLEKPTQNEKVVNNSKLDESARNRLSLIAQKVLPHRVFQCAKNNDAVALQEFISSVKPEYWKTARNEYGDTLLHIAVMFLAEKSVQVLLNNSAYVNVKNVYGCTPLDFAQGLRKDRFIKNKLQADQGVKLPFKEREKAQRCRFIAVSLKKYGASGDNNIDYHSVLTYCQAMQAHVRGYDLNTFFDDFGNTLLHTAIARNNIKECHFLMAHGLSLFTSSKQGISCYDFLIALYESTECDIFNKLTGNINISFMQVDHEPFYYDIIRKYVNALRTNSASRNRYGKQSQ